MKLQSLSSLYKLPVKQLSPLKKNTKLPKLYLGGEFFDYHYQLDHFLQASLGMKQESNLWTAQPFKRLGCKFTPWTASVMPKTGRKSWRGQTRDLWPPSLGPPQGIHLKCSFQGLGQILFFALILQFGRGRLPWTSPFVPTVNNEHLCFAWWARPCV